MYSAVGALQLGNQEAAALSMPDESLEENAGGSPSDLVAMTPADCRHQPLQSLRRWDLL